MSKDVKSNLKSIIDNRKGTRDEISLRQLAEQSGLKFETVRRLYHDETKQYQRKSIAAICDTLNIELCDLLVLVDE